MTALNAQFISRTFRANSVRNNAVSPYRGRHSAQSAPNGGAICRRLPATPCNWNGDATREGFENGSAGLPSPVRYSVAPSDAGLVDRGSGGRCASSRQAAAIGSVPLIGWGLLCEGLASHIGRIPEGSVHGRHLARRCVLRHSRRGGARGGSIGSRVSGHARVRLSAQAIPARARLTSPSTALLALPSFLGARLVRGSLVTDNARFHGGMR